MRLLATMTLAALMTGSALAGDFAILSMHHSADHFVPHLRFDGVVAKGDAAYLADVLENMPRCAESCNGASAVLSLDSAGGNYIEAMALADLLRREKVATLVEAADQCLSACLTAFAGGTRRTLDGDEPDRIAVPGARLLLLPLEQQDERLAHAILENGLERTLGAPLEQLQSMATDGALGLPVELSDQLVPTGSVWARDLTTPNNLALLGATLPPSKVADLVPDLQAALLQACGHALSRYYATKDIVIVPEDAEYNIDPAFQRNLGSIGGQGYRIQDTEATFCTGDIERDISRVWLFGPGEEGTEELLGLDIAPHMVFPVSDPTSDLERFYRPFVDAWTFKDRPFATAFPDRYDDDFDTDFGFDLLLETLTSRFSVHGELLVFEQVGDQGLGEALQSYLKSPALVDQATVKGRMVSITRATGADTGNAVYIAAVGGRHANWIGRIEADRPWSELTRDELTMISKWGCNVMAIGEQPLCD